MHSLKAIAVILKKSYSLNEKWLDYLLIQFLWKTNTFKSQYKLYYFKFESIIGNFRGEWHLYIGTYMPEEMYLSVARSLDFVRVSGSVVMSTRTKRLSRQTYSATSRWKTRASSPNITSTTPTLPSSIGRYSKRCRRKWRGDPACSEPPLKQRQSWANTAESMSAVSCWCVSIVVTFTAGWLRCPPAKSATCGTG